MVTQHQSNQAGEEGSHGTEESLLNIKDLINLFVDQKEEEEFQQLRAQQQQQQQQLREEEGDQQVMQAAQENGTSENWITTAK